MEPQSIKMERKGGPKMAKLYRIRRRKMERLIKVVQDVIDVIPADWSPDEIN